jgi:hypothetical protein
MDTATLIALAKGLKAKGELPAGEHTVNEQITLHVEGIIKVGEDQEITPTASLMSVEFLLLTLRAAGITREAAMSAISEVADGYLVDWTGSAADKKAAKAARKSAVAEFDPEGKGAKVFDDFKGALPKIPRKGRVTFKGEVSEVASSISEVAISEVA